MTNGNKPKANVSIVEVGPRDGLQNEPVAVPTAAKVRFIEALAAAGLRTLEATSFVNPKAVPQLADAASVMANVKRRAGVRYLGLVPNERGYDRARQAGVDAVALFAAATDDFSRANVGTHIEGSFERFRPVASRAIGDGCWLRGYVSVAFGCPFLGKVSPSAVIDLAERLFDLGCHEVALADTIGAATPAEVASMLADAVLTLPVDRLALHFHDTGGLAIDNVAAGLAGGVRIFDASAGGLGGCPFAPDAPGNLATETLIAALHRWGCDTGVDREKVVEAVAELTLSRTGQLSPPDRENGPLAAGGS